MKTYGEVNVNLNGVSLERFGEVAEVGATGGWARDRSKDEEMKRTDGGGAWFTFTLTGHKSLPSAFLFLTQKVGDGAVLATLPTPSRARASLFSGQ